MELLLQLPDSLSLGEAPSWGVLLQHLLQRTSELGYLGEEISKIVDSFEELLDLFLSERLLWKLKQLLSHVGLWLVLAV